MFCSEQSSYLAGVAAPTKNMTADEKAAVDKAKVPNHPAHSQFNQEF